MSCLFEPIHGRFPTKSLCDSYPDCIGCNYSDSFKQPKQTNADRIRAMSDEELAVFLEKVADGCDSCPMLEECAYSVGEISKVQIRLKWLKQDGGT